MDVVLLSIHWQGYTLRKGQKHISTLFYWADRISGPLANLFGDPWAKVKFPKQSKTTKAVDAGQKEQKNRKWHRANP